MSRIFEALQQSEFERGISEPFLAVTDLLRAAEINRTEAAEERWPEVEPCRNQESEHARPEHGEKILRSAIGSDSRLVSITDAWSLPAEKFRLLALRLRQLRHKRPITTVLITSTLPQEGKSFVASNLAVIMSRKRDQKILLIDGDLRRPSLAKNFGLGQLFGLSECLKNGTPIRDSIYFLEDLGFWFLPAGIDSEHSLELMQSGGLSEKLKQLSSSFDWIIIDSPPLVPLADTPLWSKLADGTLLVTRQGKTEKRILQCGLELLDKSTLMGVVLNSSRSADRPAYYERYGYGSPGVEQGGAVTSVE
ncbi:MAG: CpsD/CapB family tyrosine-protein kinase [Acidobacteria bacterium]|nr:CpsD/CapB family tyrosine-protein kinase [Acidobacteriota bacterium]